jgi:signal transduction histidine kinase
MYKLRTRFALSLSIILVIATLLPMLIFYLLGISGLVEITYVTESQDIEYTSNIPDLPISTPLGMLETSTPPLISERLGMDGFLSLPPIDPVTGKRNPVIAFDPKIDRWIAKIPSDLQRVVFTSPLFKFRVDLPAWFVLSSLPIITLLIGIFMSFWLSRGVTQPISQLAQAVNAVDHRDLGFRVATKGSQELQDLARSFNHMAEDLERTELTRHNLMADIAHELRTPLSVLEGNLRAMLDGIHEKNEEEIALLYEQTHHLKRLVDDLRELSLAEADQLSLNLQEVDLVQLVKDTTTHFDALAQENNIQLDLELNESIINPCLDEHRMRQVLHNLLSNAIRYTPKGGKVTVSSRLLPDKSAFEISIADNGIGILPEDLPYIFDRFNHPKGIFNRNQEGTGLGLAIVKALVEAQGGSVSVQSGGENKGSTFTLHFPVLLDSIDVATHIP